MARTAGNAYAAASRAAYDIKEDVIRSLLSRIAQGEVDGDTLHDAIHEEVDNALIYTADQWVLAYGLRDEEDAIEEGLCQPANFSEALAAQAYCNLRAAVCDYDFSEALAVARDAAEERGEVAP